MLKKSFPKFSKSFENLTFTVFNPLNFNSSFTEGSERTDEGETI